MPAMRFREESGYSLVEVMVSILILTIAILPMMTMFDTGIDSANRGSNYDKARALAKKQLEQAESLSYGTVRTAFPNAPCAFDNSGLCAVANLEVPAAEDPNGEFDNFRYAIRKQYVEPVGNTFDERVDDTGMMEITVVVGWGGANFNEVTYTTSALKVR